MTHPLPENVRAALDRGDKIEAIRLLREATGLGLADAKTAVEMGAVPAPAAFSELPPQVSAAIVAGNKIEAIKLLREATGLGLKEAMDAVEAAAIRAGVPFQRNRTNWTFVVIVLALTLLAVVLMFSLT